MGQFVTPANGGYVVSYRFFHDSYGVIANTAAITWNQKIGKNCRRLPDVPLLCSERGGFYSASGFRAIRNLPSLFSFRLPKQLSLLLPLTISWQTSKPYFLEHELHAVYHAGTGWRHF